MASIVSAGTTSATSLNLSADTSGVLQLASNNGTVALTIATTQFVNIGTASSSYPFQISTNPASSSNPMLAINPTTGTNASYIYFNNSGSGGFNVGRSDSAGAGSGLTLTAYDSFVATTGTTGISFNTNNTRAMYIDSGQNVMVGVTSSLGSKLSVNSEMSLGTDGNNRGILTFSSGGIVFGTINASTTYFNSMTLKDGSLLVGETTNSSAGGKFSVYQSSTGNAEAARITSNAASYSCFYSLAKNASFNDNVIGAAADRAASSAFVFYNATANSVLQFKVTGNGVIYAQNTTVQSASDARMKENIVNATDGLNVITALRTVRFDFKEGFGNNRKNQLGFIAQEIEQVFPDAVDVWGESDDPEEPYKSVGPAALIPVLVKAIQEQQAIIETLTNRITALEAK